MFCILLHVIATIEISFCWKKRLKEGSKYQIIDIWHTMVSVASIIRSTMYYSVARKVNLVGAAQNYRTIVPCGKLLHFFWKLQLLLYMRKYVIDYYDSDPFILMVKRKISKLGLYLKVVFETVFWQVIKQNGEP